MTPLHYGTADPDGRPTLVEGTLTVSVGSEASLAAGLQRAGKHLLLARDSERPGNDHLARATQPFDPTIQGLPGRLEEAVAGANVSAILTRWPDNVDLVPTKSLGLEAEANVPVGRDTSDGRQWTDAGWANDGASRSVAAW